MENKELIPEEYLPVIRRLVKALHPELEQLTEEEWKEAEAELGKHYDIVPNNLV